MITKPKVIRNINAIRKNHPVKFRNFGGFVFKLLMHPVIDQEFIVQSLLNMAMAANKADEVVLIGINSVQVNLKDSEKKLKFLLEHSFRCRICGSTCTEETNVYSNKLRCICGFCMDKNQEYQNDYSVANQLYD